MTSRPIWRVQMSQSRWAIVAVALPVLVLLLLMPRWFQHLDPLTGDEPFYVMTAMSLWDDRDLDETNNYAKRDYERFYPETPLPDDWQGWPSFPQQLPPHPAQTDRDGLYSKHGVGLAALIALPWRVAERAGAVLVVVVSAAIMAAGMFAFARRSGASPAAACGATLALALTMPLLPYALLLFPEVPAAAALIVAVLALTDQDPPPWLAVAAGVGLGLLPWLHQRFLLACLALGLFVVVDRALRHNWRALMLTSAPAVLGAIGIAAYNWWLYGQLTQNTADHAGFHGGVAFLNAGAGLLLDAQWGLLIAAPLALVAIAATPHWARANPRLALVATLAVVPYVTLVEAYRVWWGEWGPPARYLVPIVPLAVGPLASVLRDTGRVGRGLVIGGVALGALPLLAGLAEPQRLYHHPNGVNRLWQSVGHRLHLPLERGLVAFQPYAVDSVSARLVAVAIMLLLLAALWLTLQRAWRPVHLHPQLRTASRLRSRHR